MYLAVSGSRLIVFCLLLVLLCSVDFTLYRCKLSWLRNILKSGHVYDEFVDSVYTLVMQINPNIRTK